jgi:hypothetical protein
VNPVSLLSHDGVEIFHHSSSKKIGDRKKSEERKNESALKLRYFEGGKRRQGYEERIKVYFSGDTILLAQVAMKGGAVQAHHEACQKENAPCVAGKEEEKPFADRRE